MPYDEAKTKRMLLQLGKETVPNAQPSLELSVIGLNRTQFALFFDDVPYSFEYELCAYDPASSQGCRATVIDDHRVGSDKFAAIAKMKWQMLMAGLDHLR